MPKDTEKEIPRVVYRLRVVRDRFRHRLVDRFVEARKALDVGVDKRGMRRPLLDDARPQRPILGDHREFAMASCEMSQSEFTAFLTSVLLAISVAIR